MKNLSGICNKEIGVLAVMNGRCLCCFVWAAFIPRCLASLWMAVQRRLLRLSEGFYFFAIWHCTVLFTFTLQKMLWTGVSKDNVPFFFFFLKKPLCFQRNTLCTRVFSRTMQTDAPASFRLVVALWMSHVEIKHMPTRLNSCQHKYKHPHCIQIVYTTQLRMKCQMDCNYIELF